ncbi:LacI family DNA-binding transcriptional regulator [Nocardioides sp.]|uniref:LacI family DNA-binding transcriptional regulator n=1 Tax=Nocardioides sp. TaxID=35761 RepID=UPI0025F170B7|nr:LacI family DNA-binding transcriptional regulator [Nocardioides sp.]
MPVRSQKRHPTMADVAERAGVSHQTVSRVINNSPSVRPDTASRVRAAIADLGYRPNRSARMLASTHSRLIGVATWGTSHHGPQQVLLALDAAARRTEYRITVSTLHALTAEDTKEAVEELLQLGVEAVVLIIPHDSMLRFAREADLGLPTVVVEGDLSRMPLTVGIDNVQGGQIATRHLLELGHRTVVHVAGPPGWAEASARVEGWRLELEAWGREVPPLRWGGDWSAQSGYEAGVSLARDPDVTAIFAANDQMALGVIAALREAGRRVPDDVSVVGFDDLPESSFIDPPLTSVQQDFGELGRRTMALLERVLGGEKAPTAELVPTSLVVRSSTAAPRVSTP